MQSIKEQSQFNYNFIGYGGKNMSQKGLESQFDISKIKEKYFYIFRRERSYFNDFSRYMPYYFFQLDWILSTKRIFNEVF